MMAEAQRGIVACKWSTLWSSSVQCRQGNQARDGKLVQAPPTHNNSCCRGVAGRGRLNPCSSRDGTVDWTVPCAHLQQAQPIEGRKIRRRFEPCFHSKTGSLGPTFDRRPKRPHLHAPVTSWPGAQPHVFVQVMPPPLRRSGRSGATTRPARVI